MNFWMKKIESEVNNSMDIIIFKVKLAIFFILLRNIFLLISVLKAPIETINTLFFHYLTSIFMAENQRLHTKYNY